MSEKVQAQKPSIENLIKAKETWVVARALNKIVEMDRNIGLIRRLAKSPSDRFPDILLEALSRLRTLSTSGEISEDIIPSDATTKKVIQWSRKFGGEFHMILATRALASHRERGR